MERTAFSQLAWWKQKNDRKPLVTRSARQVGKTWLMKAFAWQEYKQCAYINFESGLHLINIFSTGFNTGHILAAISAEVDFVPAPQDTLIVLDEIQAAPG